MRPLGGELDEFSPNVNANDPKYRCWCFGPILGTKIVSWAELIYVGIISVAGIFAYLFHIIETTGLLVILGNFTLMTTVISFVLVGISRGSYGYLLPDCKNSKISKNFIFEQFLLGSKLQQWTDTVTLTANCELNTVTVTIVSSVL